MVSIKHKDGSLPSSQSWGEPSTCSIIPFAAFLSRRLRCLFFRLFRGEAIPAARRICRTFSRLISSFSCLARKLFGNWKVNEVLNAEIVDERFQRPFDFHVRDGLEVFGIEIESAAHK